MRVLVGLGLSWSLALTSACAAVPVEEAGSGTSGRAAGSATPVAAASRSVAAAPATASNARLTELFYQLQVLQDEVRALRGTVEEQGHLINRLRKDQKEQYLDLDQRVLRLTNRGGGGRSAPPAAATEARPGAGVATGAGAAAGNGAERAVLRDGEVYVTTPGAGPAAGTADATAGAGVASSSEQGAYTAAFDLLKARDFDASIRSFNKLIVDYPGGQYTGHAFYWLGELYLAKNSEERARQQFAQVIDLYPGHTKRGDALYKMGVVLHRLGDNHKALEYLNRVRAEHPGTKAAELAADYAKEMQ